MKKVLFTLMISIPFLACGQEMSREAGTDEKATPTNAETPAEEAQKTPNEVASANKAEGSEINWVTFQEALELQKENPKKIFMDVYTTWCGPCKMLDKNTFHDDDVVAYVNEHYYAVKFDAESTDPITYKGQEFTNESHDPNKTSGRNGVHNFTRALQVSAYPTMMFFDEEANVIMPLKGYKTPSQIEIYFKMFATDDYKTIDNGDKWAEYQATFKSTFTD